MPFPGACNYSAGAGRLTTSRYARFRPHEAERYKRLQGAMMSFDIISTLRAVISGLLGTAAFAASAPWCTAQTTPTLETVTVTAQRRETDP